MPDDKLTIPQFAAKIKAKYPEYRDMNDTLLTEKIIAKYPDYGDMVDFKKKVGGNGSLATSSPSRSQLGGKSVDSLIKSSPDNGQKLSGKYKGYTEQPQTMQEYGAEVSKATKEIQEQNKKSEVVYTPETDESKNSAAVGVYNTLVGSIARTAGGITAIGETIGETLGKPIRKAFDIPDPADDGISERQKTEDLINKLRSGASSLQNEQYRKQFNITDGLSTHDVRALIFSAPSQLADMVGGYLTRGTSFFVQSVNDNAKELEENPDSDNLSGGKRLGYLFTQAAVQAALEKFSIDKIVKNTGILKNFKQKIANEVMEEFASKGVRATAREIEEAVIKKASQWSSTLKMVGTNAGKAAIIEGATEGTQSAASDGIKLLANTATDDDVFDEQDIQENFLKNLINSSVQGAAFGGLFGGAASFAANTGNISPEIPEDIPGEENAELNTKTTENISSPIKTEQDALQKSETESMGSYPGRDESIRGQESSEGMGRELKGEEVTEAGKEEVAQGGETKPPVTRQDEINDLLDRISAHNNKSKNYSGRAKEVNEIKLAATELGLKYDDSYGKLFNKNGNKVKKRSTTTNKTETDFDANAYSLKAKETVNKLLDDEFLIAGIAIHGEDGRHMSMQQKRNALKDIRDGKNTFGTKAVYDAMQKMSDEDMVSWRNPETGQKDDIKFEDYFSEKTKELSDEELVALNSKLGEEAFNERFEEIRYDYEYDNARESEMAKQPATGEAERGAPPTERSAEGETQTEPTAAKEPTKLRSLADKIEKEGIPFLNKFKADLPEGTQIAGFNLDKAVADALRLIDDAVIAGKDIAQAIEEGIAKIRQHFKDNGVPFKNEAEFKKEFSDFVNKNASAPAEGEGGVKKTITTVRAYEGEFREGIKKELEVLGLTREVENQQEAKAKAKEFIASVGEETALAAVRNNEVSDAAGAYVWNEVIESVEKKLLTEKDHAKQAELEKLEAQLIDEFSRKALSGGRFSAALNDIYQSSDLGYNLQRKIQEYKDNNDGVIPPEVEAKFKDLDRQLKEVKTQLAEAEKLAKDAEEKAALLAIEEDVSRKKKTYTESARIVANNFRQKLKTKPLVFKDANGNEIPIQAQGVTWNDLVELGAKAIEVTGEIADGVKVIVDKLKDVAWYSKLDDASKKAVVKQVEDYFNEGEWDSGEATTGKIKIPHSLIRRAVKMGVKDIESLTETIKDWVSHKYPDATHREIRDAITQYGKTVNLKKEDIEIAIRKMKRIGRIVSALEDIENKKRPLRSGLQRDKLDSEERALNKQLREAMKELPVDTETQQKQLKTALDAAKQRIRNHIEDLQREIDTKEKAVKEKKLTPEDEELKNLKTQRDELKKEHDSIFNDNERTEEQKLKLALRATEKSIEEYERRIKEKDTEVKKTKHVTVTEELKFLRQKRDELKEEYKKIQEDAGVFEKRRLDNAKNRAKTKIDDLQRRIKEGDFSKKQTKPVVADDDLIKLNAEKLRLQEEYDKEFYKNELKNRTRIRKIKDALWEAWGITRALRATGEFSFVLLQGGIQTISHPLAAAKALKNSLRFFASEGKAETWLRTIKSQEWYPVLKESKLALTEVKAEITAREELFYSGWTNIIWDIIGLPVRLAGRGAHERWKKANPFKAVERAAVGYLDTLRVERFLDGMDMLQKQGKTFYSHKQDYKDVADAINTLTGRASLGKLDMVSETLSKVFFSPRLWASAVKTTTPYAFYHFGKMTPTARKMAIMDYSKFIGFTTAMVAMAAAYFNNDDNEETNVELDPRSSDCGKIRIGQTRIDPWGGRMQMIVLQARLIMDATKNNKGNIIPLGTPYKSSTRKEILLRMVTNKLAPSASILNQYLSTKLKKVEGGTQKVDEFGQPYSLSEEMLQNLYPIYVETVQDLTKDDLTSLDGVLLFYAFFGGGVQTYESTEKK